MRTRIWVDIETGSWGVFDNIYTLNATDEEIDYINEASDSERIEYVAKNGKPLIVKTGKEK